MVGRKESYDDYLDNIEVWVDDFSRLQLSQQNTSIIVAQFWSLFQNPNLRRYSWDSEIDG